MEIPRVVVLGGGASGTLLASELLRQVHPIEIVIVEPRSAPGRGLAYSTDSPVHLLNVRAGRMSARADEPGHFLHWLQQRQAGATEATFASRRLYGEYLEHALAEALLVGTRTGSSLRHVRDRATSLDRDGEAWRVQLAGGETLVGSAVVLALGNGAPAGWPTRPDPAAERERFVADPWSAGALDIAAHEDVLLVGTGLTAVDVALALSARGHRGRIYAVSRRGLLPKTQAAAQPPLAPATLGGAPASLEPASPTARVFGDSRDRADLNRLTRAFHAEARRLVANGGDWHDLFEAARPLTAAVWAGFSWEHRRRFLRHLQPYWDVHRHRMARAVADALEALRASGQLEFRAARIVGFAAAEGGVLLSLAPRGGAQHTSLRVHRVMLCTGPGPLSTSGQPLLQGLLQRGLVRLDPLGLGLDALPDGGLVDPSGAPARNLFALGPLLKGVRWETTAIPEIRVQALALARRVAETLRSAGRAATSLQAVPVEDKQAGEARRLTAR